MEFASSTSLLLHTTNQTGTNVGGLAVKLSGGGGTGTGTPGQLQFLTYDTSGISSTTPQVATVKMVINGETGNVGIGTASPTAKLNVVGTLKFVTGNEANGKILTSDASGNADWQTPATTSSGAYLPTYSSPANIDTVILDSLSYSRVGDVVTVSGELQVNVTLAATATSFLLTIPVTSSFTAASQCGGAGNSPTAVSWSAGINAASGTSTVKVAFVSTVSVTQQPLDFIFQYRIR